MPRNRRPIFLWSAALLLCAGALVAAALVGTPPPKGAITPDRKAILDASPRSTIVLEVDPDTAPLLTLGDPDGAGGWRWTFTFATEAQAKEARRIALDALMGYRDRIEGR